MKNLSIAKKLISAFAIILLLYCVSVGLAIFWGINSVTTAFEGFYNGPHAVSLKAMDLRQTMNVLEKDIAGLILSTDAMTTQSYKEDMDKAATATLNAIEFLGNHLTRQENKDRLNQVIELRKQATASRTELLEYLDKGDKDTAFKIYKLTYAPYMAQIHALTIQISETTEQVGNEYYTGVLRTQRNIMTVLIAIIAFSVIVAAVLGTLIVRGITKPVQEIERAAKLLAEGHLDIAVSYQSKDEVGSLANSIRTLIGSLKTYIFDIGRALGEISSGNLAVTTDLTYVNDFKPIQNAIEQILNALNSLMSQISDASSQVSSGSQQMSSGAQQLSQGATEQAASIEELASGIAEIADSVKISAQNARKTSAYMNETSQEIAQGDRQMKKLVTAMDEIESSSSEIQKIIKTIDDIAFQTNILALNAAVEAARAGEAGKGFAVVADEVRNLASKSAEAAKNTTVLIQTTLDAIANGDKMVNDTERALQQIAQKADAAVKLVEEIAHASEAQAISVGEINSGVAQISSVVQINSATAEETAAASEELSAQALSLQSEVDKFTLRQSSVTI